MTGVRDQLPMDPTVGGLILLMGYVGAGIPGLLAELSLLLCLVVVGWVVDR